MAEYEGRYQGNGEGYDEYAASYPPAQQRSSGFDDYNDLKTQSIHWSTLCRLIIGMCWHLIHLMISIAQVGSELIQLLSCYLISSGMLKKFQVLQLNKLRYLAIVVDSEEAKHVMKIRELLNWLSTVGINHVILYDMQGVLKNSEVNLEKISGRDSLKFSDIDIKVTVRFPSIEKMSLELLSLSDGKEMIAKAASFLYSKHLRRDNLCDQKEIAFTEVDMANALGAVGGGGPQADLLLVFGPARCHLGFPAWRMRYTEIVHMGSLKFLQYGAVIKAIHDFSIKNQNYGS